MSNYANFMKEKKIKREPVTVPVSSLLVDEDGEVLKWTFKPVTTKEELAIKEECTVEVPVAGKKDTYKNKLDTTKYKTKMICASVVEPNLNNKGLQDSYGVMTPEDLLVEMIDNYLEYKVLYNFIRFISSTHVRNKVENEEEEVI